MDKIAANNLIVGLKKEAKKAKAMVGGNLVRKINKLKSEKDLNKDEAQAKKIDDKINHILNEIKLLKTLDCYDISKQAIQCPDAKKWENTIGDSKASNEKRLTARVIQKNAIQKLVSRFIVDHKDCKEWLEEYFEYREKKKDLTSFSKDKKVSRPKRVIAKVDKLPKSAQSRNTYDDNSSVNQKRKSESSYASDAASKDENESLHPSWKSKRKEKELLKAALSGKLDQPKHIKFN